MDWQKLVLTFILLSIGLILAYQGSNIVKSFTGNTVLEEQDISNLESLRFNTSENAKLLRIEANSDRDNAVFYINEERFSVDKNREINIREFKAGRTNEFSTGAIFDNINQVKITEYSQVDLLIQRISEISGIFMIFLSIVISQKYDRNQRKFTNLKSISKQAAMILAVILLLQTFLAAINISAFTFLEHSTASNYVKYVEAESSGIYENSMEETYSNLEKSSCDRFDLAGSCNLESMANSIDNREPQSYGDIRQYLKDSAWLAYLSWFEALKDSEGTKADNDLERTILASTLGSSYSLVNEYTHQVADDTIKNCKNRNITPERCLNKIQRSSTEDYNPKRIRCDIKAPRKLEGIPNRFQKVLRFEFNDNDIQEHLKCDQVDKSDSIIVNEILSISMGMAESSAIMSSHPSLVVERMSNLNKTIQKEVKK